MTFARKLKAKVLLKIRMDAGGHGVQRGLIRSRKRRRKQGNWTHAKRKKLRNTGKAYVTASGEDVPERTRGNGCTGNCEFKCAQNLSDEQRDYLFEEFWKIGDFD